MKINRMNMKNTSKSMTMISLPTGIMSAYEQSQKARNEETNSLYNLITTRELNVPRDYFNTLSDNIHYQYLAANKKGVFGLNTKKKTNH